MCTTEPTLQVRPGKTKVADQYGQNHIVETPEMRAKALIEFEKELDNIPNEHNEWLNQAKEKCPDQLTDDFKLMFLRCDQYNVKLAAKRYVHYWKMRVEICGPDLAFLPMTQDGALKNDEKTLNTCAFTCIEKAKEPMGRAVVGFFPVRLIDEHKHTNEALVRYIWYIAHAALESETAQRYGIVVLLFPGPLKLTQMNRKFEKMMVESTQGALPTRVSAVHVCRPPSFTRIVWPIIQMLMNKRLRKRVLFHFGTNDKIMKALQAYGLEKEHLPSEIGGDIEHDHKAWLKQRRLMGK